MYWSITLVVAAVLGAGDVQTTTEFDSYTTAYWTASEQHRPMLVLLQSSGEEAAALAELKESAASRDVLEDYVVVVIDTTTEHGQQVFELFGSPNLPQTIVIDERQQKQVFRTSETLSPVTMAAVLQQYRDGVPQTVTAARPIITEPMTSQPIISQPATSQPIYDQPIYGEPVIGQPAPMQGSLNYFQQAPGNCPNCRKF